MGKSPILLGVPFNSNGSQGGVASAPAVLHNLLPEYAWQFVAWDGDTTLRDPATKLANYPGLSNMIRATAEVTGEVLSHRVPFLIGGDCAILLGAIQGAAEKYQDIGLIFIDGHEDAWPPEKSPTGEAADSEMGLILGLWGDVTIDSYTKTIEPSRVAILGPRDQQETEKGSVPSIKAMVYYRNADSLAHDMATCVKDTLALMHNNGAHFWLHIDLDVLSSDELSAIDYPQEGGITWDLLGNLSCEFVTDPLCLGCSIVIYNPELDPGFAQASRVAEFIRILLKKDDQKA